MALSKKCLVNAIKSFNEHFEIDTPLKQHQFILGGDAVGLITGIYASVGEDVITIYLRRNPEVPYNASKKYIALLGLFTGETIANYGGITEITIQINEHTFKVSPQPKDHDCSGFDTISRIIEVFG